jgi:hypothetical protein
LPRFDRLTPLLAIREDPRDNTLDMAFKPDEPARFLLVKLDKPGYR